MNCKDCKYMKMYKKFGNQRGECMCNHPLAVETFNKVCPRSPRMAGFISHTVTGTDIPQTKTAPRWCPLKEETHD